MAAATSLISGSKVGHMAKRPQQVLPGSSMLTTSYDCLSAGIDASVLVQAKQMRVCARLRDVVVTDVNPDTVHRKVSSKEICVTCDYASNVNNHSIHPE